MVYLILNCVQIVRSFHNLSTRTKNPRTIHENVLQSIMSPSQTYLWTAIQEGSNCSTGRQRSLTRSLTWWIGDHNSSDQNFFFYLSMVSLDVSEPNIGIVNDDAWLKNIAIKSKFNILSLLFIWNTRKNKWKTVFLMKMVSHFNEIIKRAHWKKMVSQNWDKMYQYWVCHILKKGSETNVLKFENTMYSLLSTLTCSKRKHNILIFETSCTHFWAIICLFLRYHDCL